ncbi:MAG TPA: zf-HC2 domain-containing protein [Candidatus Acidoferrales bacterium]|nr:zf-HC2 domain-containing protein [Candidatus Acidoferrales bacterium]
MDWNCTLTEERLSDYLEGSLLPKEAAAFSSHASGCAQCAQLVAQVETLVSRMQKAAPVEEPPQLAGRILDATLGPRKREQIRSGRFAWLPSVWQPRFAMGMVTVAATFLIIFHASPTSGSKAALNPVNLFRTANRQIHLTYAHGAKFVNDLRVVYEIQSRLTSQPETISEPMPAPAGAPNAEPRPGEPAQPPASEEHQKSQSIPHSGRRQTHGASELAALSIISREGFSSGASRSVL